MERVTEAELVSRAVAPRVTEKDLERNISKIEYLNTGLLTICVITLKNGFMVTGESACASPENYQQDIGERIALNNARNEIWPLMGYALRDHMLYGGSTYWAQPAEDQSSSERIIEMRV